MEPILVSGLCIETYIGRLDPFWTLSASKTCVTDFKIPLMQWGEYRTFPQAVKMLHTNLGVGRCSHAVNKGVKMYHPVHGVFSETRINGVGRRGGPLVSQLLQFCACPRPLLEQDQLGFIFFNQLSIKSSVGCWHNNRQGTSWFRATKTDGYLPSTLKKKAWTILPQNLANFGSWGENRAEI